MERCEGDFIIPISLGSCCTSCGENVLAHMSEGDLYKLGLTSPHGAEDSVQI